MSTMTMPQPQAFHRKPVPSYGRPPPQAPPHQQPALYGNVPEDPTHSRSATFSSQMSGMPSNGSPASKGSGPYAAPNQQHPMYPQTSRRTLSNGTSSTSSTNTNSGPQAGMPGTMVNPPRRSTSSRSNNSVSPSSYVALMRKQKATVWCDRAQHEDPRILAAQRQAKMRAAMEVAGGHNHPASRGSASTSMVNGVRSKIRHHGAPKASTYNAAVMGGAGVPVRLSAMEVDNGESDEEGSRGYHGRTGSGRSSLTNVHRAPNSYANSQRQGYSATSTPAGVSPEESMSDLMEEQTPVPNRSGIEGNDYFAHAGGNGESAGSGGSVQREESFGNVGTLPQSKPRTDLERRKSEELRRRGSVDDRSMTLGGGRLFVANPDLSD